MEPTRGRLVLAATPIDSYTHASPALQGVPSTTDVIAAEDTHHLAAPLCRIDVTATARVLSYFKDNEVARTAELTEVMADGQDVVLVTGTGMPSVSDPEYHLVAACVKRNLPVTAVPGPLAVLTALAVSGLPRDRFCFKGFLPRKAGERCARLTGLTAEEHTMIFFEALHRLHEQLFDAAGAFGADRRAMICRKLTELHGEIVRDDLARLARWVAGGVRDEVTVVVAKAESVRVGTSDALGLVTSRIADGEKLSQAVRVVADLLRVPRKELYEAALTARRKEQ